MTEITKTIVGTLLLGLSTSPLITIADPLPQTSAQNPASGCVTISTLTGAGSGFFLEQNGQMVIITCRHVVEHSPFLRITDMNGREYIATNAMLSTIRDIACLQIENTDGNVLPLTTIDGANELVFDMDLFCYGDSEGKGVIVKSKGHLLGIGPESIETDAAIVPGNSGGPIVTPDTGKVIAVASYLTKTRTTQWTEGTRFEDAVRRFGVRIDNLDLSDSSLIQQKLVRKDDYAAIAQFGEELLEVNNQELIQEAKACLEYAAMHGNREAKTVLAQNYITGANWKTDDYKGFSLAREAAVSGSSDAMYLLSQCLILGIGTTPDISQGMDWLMKSASNNCEIAQYCLGKDYLDGTNITKNVDQGFFWILRSAEQGFGPAQARLGKLYEDGIGTESNSVKAVDWYKKAAEVGDPDGLYSLGWCYLKGMVVEKDEVKGHSYLERAADAGHIDAEIFVGIGLQHGVMGFRKDENKAFLFFQSAASKNNKDGYSYLGECYEWGRGCDQNSKLAIINYIKAGSLGETEKWYYAGLCLSTGKMASGAQVEKNYEMAEDLLKMAAGKGNTKAMSYLGRSYFQGRWVQKDHAKSLQYMQKAAELKDALGMFGLGMYYYFGSCGLNQDVSRGISLIKEAAKMGHKPAIQFLSEHNRR